jgi:hypothetical protein
LSFISASKASAFLTSDFDINVGQSSFQAKFQANREDQTKNLSSLSSVEFNYNLRQSSSGIAYNMSFFEMLNTKEGYLSFTRFSAGARWYPRGMNGGRVVIDNDVTAKIWKATPFFGVNLGVANMSVKEFNASFTDLTPRFGVELPLTSRVLLVAQFVVASSLSSGGASVAKAITYQGQSALIGITATNFLE